MNHDPTVFDAPETFRPERFLDATGVADVAPPDTHGMGHVTFGFGRRICVGLNFANQALFINFATILWAMDICKARDAQGREVTPDPDDLIDAGVVVCVSPVLSICGVCVTALRRPHFSQGPRAVPVQDGPAFPAGQGGTRARACALCLNRLSSPHAL